MLTNIRAKTLLSLLLALVLTMGMLPLAAFAVETHTVRFETDSPTSFRAVTVEHGSTISSPGTPRKSGHVFRGWYKDSNCTDRWDFAKDTVTKNIVLYAGWYDREDDNYYYDGYYGYRYYDYYYGYRYYDEEYQRFTYTDDYYYSDDRYYSGSNVTRSMKIRDRKDVEGGEDQIYTGSEDITFTVYDSGVASLMSVVIYPDGDRSKEMLLVKNEDYTAKSSKGGTAVTLKPYLLDYLKNGKYQVRMYFSSEQANATFNVKL